MNTFRRFTFLLILGVLLVVAGAVSAATTTFSGTISSGSQTDVYAVYYGAGQSVVANLKCGEPPTLDTVLSLYNSANERVAYNDDGGSKSCGGFRSSLIATAIAESGTYYWHVDGFGSSTGSYTLQIVDGVAGFVPNDDRINPHAFAPVAVYCRDANSVEIWTIDAGGNGLPLFSVAGSDITAAAPGTTVGSAGAVLLSKLGDGRLQVNAPMLDGKGYVFIFDGCPVSASETYTVEGGNAVLFEVRAYN